MIRWESQWVNRAQWWSVPIADNTLDNFCPPQDMRSKFLLNNSNGCLIETAIHDCYTLISNNSSSTSSSIKTHYIINFTGLIFFTLLQKGRWDHGPFQIQYSSSCERQYSLWDIEAEVSNVKQLPIQAL